MTHAAANPAAVPTTAADETVTPADDETLRASRAAYWARNRFGADGGESLRWVPLSLFGLKVYIPNSDARRRALRFHDLHHVVTGYATDLGGEAEIGAWELASGCARFPAALILNLGAVAIGAFSRPRRALAAWARGRRTRNLYGATFGDALLERRSADVRRELGLDGAAVPPTARDVAGFALIWLAGLGLVALPVVAALAAIVALAW